MSSTSGPSHRLDSGLPRIVMPCACGSARRLTVSPILVVVAVLAIITQGAECPSWLMLPNGLIGS